MQTVDSRLLELKPGDRVLDLGCGEGRHVHNFYYFNEVHAFGIDISLDDLKVTRGKVEHMPPPDRNASRRTLSLAVADALRLPFADKTFDKVVCSEVLEHIADYESALAEIARVMKPDGVFAASVPRFFPEWVCWQLSTDYQKEPGGHVRIFRSRQLKESVEAAGFKRFSKHWAHGLHSPYWWLRCMLYKTADQNRLVKAYHRFLVWDMMKKPWLTRALEGMASPLMGKSVVMYFRRIE
jgi:ubiquinone/menaquinone biosynthesis C-methylase UbiE